jgi:hypothetical protein
MTSPHGRYVHRALVSWDNDMLYIELESMGPPTDPPSAHGRILGHEIEALSEVLAQLLARVTAVITAPVTRKTACDYMAALAQIDAASDPTDLPNLTLEIVNICTNIDPLLRIGKAALCAELSPRLCAAVARSVDETLFEAVLGSGKVTAGMACQFQYDMHAGTVRAFRQKFALEECH